MTIPRTGARWEPSPASREPKPEPPTHPAGPRRDAHARKWAPSFGPRVGPLEVLRPGSEGMALGHGAGCSVSPTTLLPPFPPQPGRSGIFRETSQSEDAEVGMRGARRQGHLPGPQNAPYIPPPTPPPHSKLRCSPDPNIITILNDSFNLLLSLLRRRSGYCGGGC